MCFCACVYACVSGTYPGGRSAEEGETVGFSYGHTGGTTADERSSCSRSSVSMKICLF